MSEIEILKRLYHLSLPRIMDVFSDEHGLYIVESNIEGTTLDRLLKQYGSFGLDKVIDWSLELCDILGYLHSVRPKPIIYRDLKPSNIILTQSSRLALVDFGISQEFCEYQSKDTFLAGTSAYAAPEQLIKDGKTDQRTDIYNLGVTMYQMLLGRLPKVKHDEPGPCKDKLTLKFCQILARCMENKPEDRYQRVEDIRQELQLLKNMLVVSKSRQKIVFKLEIATVVILSIASYAMVLLGFIHK
jgi:serine/threonine-protein kinase